MWQDILVGVFGIVIVLIIVIWGAQLAQVNNLGALRLASATCKFYNYTDGIGQEFFIRLPFITDSRDTGLFCGGNGNPFVFCDKENCWIPGQENNPYHKSSLFH